MKHVTFSRDMAPYRAGEMRLVPDELASTLAAQGDIQPNPPDFPPRAETAAPARPARQRGRVRDLLGQTYLTK